MVVTGADGAHSYAPPWTMSDHGFHVARDAPAQGEHTAEVLREAGIDGAEIEAMLADGAARR